MNDIREVDPVNSTMTVEAGMVLSDAHTLAQNHNLMFPLSMGSQGSCQIGGVLSTNAGGISVLRYGSARDLVLGLEAVLPNGEILSELKGLRKDNTGYDLKGLFLGAEGTLGVITAAVLKLFPEPLSRQTALLGVASPQAACDLLAQAQQDSDEQVISAEYISRESLNIVLISSEFSIFCKISLVPSFEKSSTIIISLLKLLKFFNLSNIVFIVLCSLKQGIITLIFMSLIYLFS